MIEIIDFALSPANVIITALLILMIVYWLVVLIGFIDLDMFDFDVDIDADADMDVDTDLDGDGIQVGWLNHVLYFFNLGQVPLMIFLTFLILPAWTITMIVTSELGISSFFVGVLVMTGALFVSLFIAKFCTMPFVKLFGKMDAEEEDEIIIGKVCTVTISTREDKVGQGHVETNGAPHLLNIRAVPGAELRAGEQGLVIEHLKNENTYLIEPYTL